MGWRLAVVPKEGDMYAEEALHIQMAGVLCIVKSLHVYIRGCEEL